MSKIEKITINVFDEIGSEAAISVDDGNNLYEKIDEALSNNLVVILDFQNINVIITAFLNAAIGQLYSKYSSIQLNKMLVLKNLQPDNVRQFKMVIERAKEYFIDRESFDKTYRDNIGDE